MKLTFDNGDFILKGSRDLANPDPEAWSEVEGPMFNVTSESYSTRYLGAAVRFRRYADEAAKKVLDRTLARSYATPAETLPRFLDPLQCVGVRHILTRSRSYLAHAPGAGKTVQSLVAAWMAKGRGQVVLIVPPSLTLNWAREVVKFHGLLLSEAPEVVDYCFGRPPGYWPSVSIVPKSPQKHTMGWRADIIIVPDSMLTKDWVLKRLIGMKKRFVAVDEASRFKEPTALRTRALFGGRVGALQSPGLVQDARHAVLLDGSPMPNRTMELWAPTIAMDPAAINYRSQNDYGFRYCAAKQNDRGEWQFSGSSNQEELHAKLTKSFMHVVTEDQLNHPERRRKMIVMTEDTRSKDQRAWELKNVDQVFQLKFEHDGNPVKKPNELQGQLASYRKEIGVQKAPWIASYTRERLAKGESVLLFVWHREVATKLAELLKDFQPALIMGGTGATYRETAFEAFQAKSCELIIGNISAMGRGHNLQAADRVIFGEYSWTDELNKQCEKRASRRGNTKLFTPCDYIVSPNSLDETMLKSIFRKASDVARVIG